MSAYPDLFVAILGYDINEITEEYKIYDSFAIAVDNEYIRYSEKYKELIGTDLNPIATLDEKLVAFREYYHLTGVGEFDVQERRRWCKFFPYQEKIYVFYS